MKTQRGWNNHEYREDSRARGHAASSKAHSAAPRPSELVDWEHALTLHALTLRELGYELSEHDLARIERHAERQTRA